MENQLLCSLLQAACGPVHGLATDSMQPLRENAPSKWMRVGVWVLAYLLGALARFLLPPQVSAVNFPAILLFCLVTAIGYHFFYDTTWRNALLVQAVLLVAVSAAELMAGLVLWLCYGTAISGDLSQPEMVLGSLVGALASNAFLFTVAVLWRRFQLKKRLHRGSWAMVVLALCLLVPTYLYCIQLMQNKQTISLFTFVTISGALLFDLMLICIQFRLAEKEELENELSELKHQRELARLHYQSIEARREELSKLRHDHNNLLASLLGMLRAGEIPQAIQALEELMDRVAQTREYPYCGIPIVNAILSEKEAECRSAAITLKTDLLFPEDIQIQTVDLCILFANLLDNSIRACRQLPPNAPRQIHLHVGVQGDYLLIRCENPAAKAPGPRPEGTGYGTKILLDLAARYHGQFQTRYENGTFSACIILLSAADKP